MQIKAEKCGRAKIRKYERLVLCKKEKCGADPVDQ